MIYLNKYNKLFNSVDDDDSGNGTPTPKKKDGG